MRQATEWYSRRDTQGSLLKKKKELHFWVPSWTPARTDAEGVLDVGREFWRHLPLRLFFLQSGKPRHTKTVDQLADAEYPHNLDVSVISNVGTIDASIRSQHCSIESSRDSTVSFATPSPLLPPPSPNAAAAKEKAERTEVMSRSQEQMKGTMKETMRSEDP